MEPSEQKPELTLCLPFIFTFLSSPSHVLHSEFISFTSTSPLLYPSTCYLPHHFLYLCLYFLSSVCFTNLPSFPKASPLLPSLLLVSISTCTLVSYPLSPSKKFLIIAYLFSFHLCYYPTCLLPRTHMHMPLRV